MIQFRMTPGETHNLPHAANDAIAARGRATPRLHDAASESDPVYDLTNVISFARAGRDEPTARVTLPLRPAERPLSPVAARAASRPTARWAALLIFSLAAHLALAWPFLRQPEPLASIGEVVISAEIIVGAHTPAGLDDQAGEDSASAPIPAQSPQPVPAEPLPEIAVATATEQVETAREAPASAARETDPVASSKPYAETPTPIEPAPAADAPAEQASTAPDSQVAPPATVDEVPVRTSEPPPVRVTAERPAATPPAPARKPVAERQKPTLDTRRANAPGPPNDSRSTAPAARSAGGVGRGSSAADSNYPGLVAAHLARYKQFPADARGSNVQGSAAVTFSLGGSGGVTSVRLARGTGVESLDREAVAMVRRASPFPAPPGGRAMSFTVPVSFRLQ